MQNINLFQKQTSTNAKEIGSCLWWTLAQCSVPRNQLEDAAKRCGIPDNYLPEKISFISAFKRGISDVKLKLEKTGILIRPVSNDAKETFMAIIKETIDSHNRVAGHNQIGLAIANKEVEKIEIRPTNFIASADHAALFGVEDLIRDAYLSAVDHNTDDVRRVITSFCKECAISLRESGGIYFVPLAYSNLLSAIKKFVLEVSPDSVIYIKPEYIINDADLQTLQKVGQSSLTNEVTDLEETYQKLSLEIEEMLNNRERLKGKKKGQITSQLQIYLDMKKRIEVFTNTLSFSPQTSNDMVQRLRVMHENLAQNLKKLRVQIKDDFDSDFTGFIPQSELVQADADAPSLRDTTRMSLTPEPESVRSLADIFASINSTLSTLL